MLVLASVQVHRAVQRVSKAWLRSRSAASLALMACRRMMR